MSVIKPSYFRQDERGGMSGGSSQLIQDCLCGVMMRYRGMRRVGEEHNYLAQDYHIVDITVMMQELVADLQTDCQEHRFDDRVLTEVVMLDYDKLVNVGYNIMRVLLVLMAQ